MDVSGKTRSLFYEIHTLGTYAAKISLDQNCCSFVHCNVFFFNAVYVKS